MATETNPETSPYLILPVPRTTKEGEYVVPINQLSTDQIETIIDLPGFRILWCNEIIFRTADALPCPISRVSLLNLRGIEITYGSLAAYLSQVRQGLKNHTIYRFVTLTAHRRHPAWYTLMQVGDSPSQVNTATFESKTPKITKLSPVNRSAVTIVGQNGGNWPSSPRE